MAELLSTPTLPNSRRFDTGMLGLTDEAAVVLCDNPERFVLEAFEVWRCRSLPVVLGPPIKEALSGDIDADFTTATGSETSCDDSLLSSSLMTASLALLVERQPRRFVAQPVMPFGAFECDEVTLFEDLTEGGRE